MTRGRRKDMSIPPSRALLQQRDYRARKAQYVTDLEERCRRTEEENEALRKEVDDLRAQLSRSAGPSGSARMSAEVATASTDLLQHLSAAASSLARFQRVSFDRCSSNMSIEDSSSPSYIPTSSTAYPQPVAPPPRRHSPSHSPPAQEHVAARYSRYSSDYDSHSHTVVADTTPLQPPAPRDHQQPQPRPIPVVHPDSHQHDPQSRATSSTWSGYNEAACCLGYLDCNGLVEDGDEEIGGHEKDHHSEYEEEAEYDDERAIRGSGQRTRLVQRTSDLRSTRSASGSEDGRRTAPTNMR